MKVVISKLKSLIENSYSPYSRFKVASIVVGDDDIEYAGVNVENVSYGLTICAERVAVFNAVTHGVRRVKRIYVASYSNEPIPPCGACLQVISEFGSEDTEIVMISLSSGKSRTVRLRDLLPLRFTRDTLREKAPRGRSVE